MKKLFNDGWSFKKTSIECTYENAMENDGWERVDLPHDWLIYQAKALYETSTGWYKKTFTADETAVYKLRFEGVYMDTVVYVNNTEAGEWKYGYSTFEIDISKYVVKGENQVVVCVRHREPNSRWYSGAGIYRNGYLIRHTDAYFASDSVYFSAEKKNDVWDVKINSIAEKADGCKIFYRLKNADESVVYEAESVCNEEHKFTIETPEIWDIDSPYLYTLEAELVKNGTVNDSYCCKVGFRDVKFSPDEGMILNGRHVKLNGVCLHHDLGGLGAAVNKEAIRRQLVKMKGMGANAVRTSHNMPAVEFMELCDEMGILVDNEAFDMWELKKTDYDYARFFNDWYKKDVESWVCRDRNHPSVIMWSIGNEIYDTHASPRGVEITRMLRDEVRKYDFNHNAYTTIGSNYIPWEGAQKCAEEVELSGYNYTEHIYEEHHKKYPHWCIYGSETAARVQSRSVYHFPKSAAYITHDDLQCSSLENCRAGVGERTAQTSIIADRDTPFSAGQFIWTGADYIGEPSPYSTKNAYYGQIDTAGFEKDSYYLYKAAWTDEIVLHLMPYWDFNEGQLIDVMVYTNQPFAELFFNGKSLGKKAIEGIYSADWQLPYEKGELKAVAYDKDGNITAEDYTRSFGDTAELRLIPDKTQLKADGADLIYVDISAFDKDGTFVANARNRVNVYVNGAARLVALDSGDSTDYDEYKCSSKKLFGGKLAAIIKAKNIAGEIEVTVKSAGLPDAVLKLEAVEAEFVNGTADAFEANTVLPENNEIPVRKIELKTETQHFNADVRTAKVTAKVYPENATHGIEWAAVTETGVKTNIADVSADGESVIVNTYGDGEFRLRCFSRNGKPAPEVISEIEMDISGIGSAIVDPYSELVKGSLYSVSKEKLNEVANGGVSVQPEGRNCIGYRKVDFGVAGTDKFTLPLIVWHNNDPVDFALWKGMPWEEGAEKLGEFTYQADFIWQTYISNTFTLDKKLKGINDICFEFEENDRRIYFGGFIFEAPDAAYSVISAADNSHIHGDTFNVSGDVIEHIGNNVFMEFDGFDFARGVKSVTVCGRTHNANDSIHLKLEGENGVQREILEFPHTDDYTEITFELCNRTGMNKVRFEFLPGCDFDFASFKFNSLE
ncbi:MAG: DUF4982 domain-containing protein [Oscillospiraceae bacterium]|nr:DUF4982 domain-containing protein [Oscillospiraceae bacterium]